MNLFTIHPTTIAYETVTINELDILVPTKLETVIDLPNKRMAKLVLTCSKDTYAIKFIPPKDLEGLSAFWGSTEKRYLYGMSQALNEYKKAVQELPRHLENIRDLIK
ncbi:MAG: hypothetical protein BroJett014_11530 [Planctomycetota bacterium]|nr:hypothetical protein [Planctomycetota bacterium]GIK52180.1 MAG: hypothetical protein BroJett014_11530 [Planctomycetota bacterium]